MLACGSLSPIVVDRCSLAVLDPFATAEAAHSRSVWATDASPTDKRTPHDIQRDNSTAHSRQNEQETRVGPGVHWTSQLRASIRRRRLAPCR